MKNKYILMSQISAKLLNFSETTFLKPIFPEKDKENLEIKPKSNYILIKIIIFNRTSPFKT